jgi:hypothetical protein
MTIKTITPLTIPFFASLSLVVPHHHPRRRLLHRRDLPLLPPPLLLRRHQAPLLRLHHLQEQSLPLHRRRLLFLALRVQLYQAPHRRQIRLRRQLLLLLLHHRRPRRSHHRRRPRYCRHPDIRGKEEIW